MYGELWYEIQMEVPASVAWDLVGTCRLGKLVREMKNMVQDIQFVHGDGGVGTIVLISLVPGFGFDPYKEKFTKVDNKNRIKETEMVEGAFLNLGFNLYRNRIHIVEKGEATCTAKLTIEYDVKEEFAANASLVTLDRLVAIFEFAKAHLIHNHNNTNKSTYPENMKHSC